MSQHDQLDDLKPPALVQFISICSNKSDCDKFKYSPIRLVQWNSYFEPNEVPEKSSVVQGETNNINDESVEVEGNVHDEKIEIKQEDSQSCSCYKSQCLKMYCSCFRNGKVCGISCKCEDCNNKEEFKQQRNKAVEQVKKKANRNKKIPKEKIFETTEIWGCNCSKTKCVKKYCECFIRGKKCTVECTCNHCDNGKDEDLFNEIRRQNEKPNLKKRIRKERQPLQ